MAHYTQRLIGTFGSKLFEREQTTGASSRAPIFIIGMPRSGTTLIEQILSSHPHIQAFGEMLHMDEAISSAFSTKQVPLSYPDSLATLKAKDLGDVGHDYLSRVPELATGKTRFTDKLPANFLNIGLIHLTLPNARIIHVDRDPLDTCVSCFSKLFRRGQEFTYELGELGRYYRRYYELMAHWRSVLPENAILDVTYENLIEDVEGQSRRLIEYCGLEWDDRCLRFYETQRAIDTASAVQVRKPAYRGSIGRWRRYASYIAPLKDELLGILSG